MPAAVVFFDIAGPDDAALRAFYAKVFGWEAGPGGQFAAPVASPLPTSFRKDPTQLRLYLGVDDVTATLNLIHAAGGHIEAPRFEVPGVVVLGLFTDPAGNPLGLVEMRDGKPKVPQPPAAGA